MWGIKPTSLHVRRRAHPGRRALPRPRLSASHTPHLPHLNVDKDLANRVTPHHPPHAPQKMKKSNLLLNRAFGIGGNLDPLSALEEVADALEAARVPSGESSKLVASAIRKCLAATTPGGRDLLAAAGWRNKRGGRYGTPAALQRQQALAQAASAAMQAAPGRTAKEKAAHVARQLADAQSSVSAPEDDRALAEQLRAAGFSKRTSPRTIQEHAKRAEMSSI